MYLDEPNADSEPLGLALTLGFHESRIEPRWWVLSWPRTYVNTAIANFIRDHSTS